MSLSEAEELWLSGLFSEVDEILERPGLNSWEKRFLRDLSERFHEYSENLRLSPKQWKSIRIIADKVRYDIGDDLDFVGIP